MNERFSLGPCAIAADLAHRAKYALEHHPMRGQLGLTADRISVIDALEITDPKKYKRLGFSVQQNRLCFRDYVIVDVTALARKNAEQRAEKARSRGYKMVTL